VLHAYWDRIFGGYSSPFGAVFDADTNDGITGIAVNNLTDAPYLRVYVRQLQQKIEASRAPVLHHDADE
jgi:hypothetical protein